MKIRRAPLKCNKNRSENIVNGIIDRAFPPKLLKIMISNVCYSFSFLLKINLQQQHEQQQHHQPEL